MKNQILQDHKSWVEIDISTKKFPKATMKIDCPDWARLQSMGVGRICPNLNDGNIYCRCQWNGKMRYVHRLILEVEGSVDHVNHNGTDNRRLNLRPVSHRQNLMNMKRKTSSRFPGVHWSKLMSKWQARIQFDGVRRNLGFFENERDAAKAYIKALQDAGEEILH